MSIDIVDIEILGILTGIDSKVSALKASTGSKIDVSSLIKNWNITTHLQDTDHNSFESLSDFNFEDITPDTQFHKVEIKDIVKLLDSLSKNALNESEKALNVKEIRSALKSSLSNLSEEGILTIIDKVSENVLNLVSHLFENINNDGNLIGEVAAQISRIQTPVMQVALTDTKLFQNSNHPVRKYLNTLGDLGLRISAPSEEGYLEMRDSITEILKYFDGDIEYFTEADQLLSDYIDNGFVASSLTTPLPLSNRFDTM